MGARRRGRELALQMLYQHELSGATVDRIATSFDDLFHVGEVTRAFAVNLAHGVETRVAEIDAVLAGQADHWRIDRMAAVDRNILRIAMYELIFLPETPAAVVIDEAVEVAKRFGSERSSQFVNGVLDGYVHHQGNTSPA